MKLMNAFRITVLYYIIKVDQQQTRQRLQDKAPKTVPQGKAG